MHFPVFYKIKFTSILLLFTTFFTFTAAPALAAISYLYDANGNMTSDGTNCYTYNEANELSEVRNCSSNQLIAQYIYDSNGMRIAKKEYTNGTLATTIYSPRDDYETTKISSSGATSNITYYFANNQLLAKKNNDGSKDYYLSDHLGSATLLVDQSGNVVESTSYEPYGKVRSGGLASKYQYTGQEKDLETGLNYYNARYYSSDIAHFTQPDQVIPLIYNPQTLNRYSYVYNNPLTYNDPSGRFGLTFGLNGSGGAAGYLAASEDNYIVWDKNPFRDAQFGVVVTVSGGQALGNTSGAGVEAGITTAKNSSEMGGASGVIGGSLTAFGAEYGQDLNDSNNKSLTVSASLLALVGDEKGEGHIGVAKSYVIPMTGREFLIYNLAPAYLRPFLLASNKNSQQLSNNQNNTKNTFLTATNEKQNSALILANAENNKGPATYKPLNYSPRCNCSLR